MTRTLSVCASLTKELSVQLRLLLVTQNVTQNLASEVLEQQILLVLLKRNPFFVFHEFSWFKLHNPTCQVLHLAQKIVLSVLNALFSIVWFDELEVDDFDEQDEQLLEVLAHHLLAVQHDLGVLFVALDLVQLFNVHLVRLQQQGLTDRRALLGLQDVVEPALAASRSVVFESLVDLEVDLVGDYISELLDPV